jgi:putative pyruvate formate lyase activating enzyme
MLRLLDGIIDIYLPDIRYADNEIARKYSHVKGYVEVNRAGIKEMHHQVGNLVVNEDGIAQRGLIVRHLILPERLAGSDASLTWLAEEISPEVHLSIMAQYYPAHHAPRYPALTRRINEAEYIEVMAILERLGMENGWFQELDAPESYQPDFTREGHPFRRESTKCQ